MHNYATNLFFHTLYLHTCIICIQTCERVNISINIKYLFFAIYTKNHDNKIYILLYLYAARIIIFQKVKIK